MGLQYLKAYCKEIIVILHKLELIILEYQPIAYIHTKGKQGDGYFGYHTGVLILYKGVIATDINNGTVHGHSSEKIRP